MLSKSAAFQLPSDFWESSNSYLFCNPRTPQTEQVKIAQLPAKFPHLVAHIWLATSGSSGPIKWTALSKKALLASAKSVNQHLSVNKEDRWLNPLPHFHVGGLSVSARSYLAQFEVINCEWNAYEYYQKVLTEKITLSALVPTQVFDLISLQQPAPSSLRAVIVGGGRLSSPLYDQAIKLGWPLLPSYGLTECASQVSTMPLKDVFTQQPRMEILSHIKAVTTAEGFLKIQSESLLTGYAIEVQGDWQFSDPKEDGWFCVMDKVVIDDSYIGIFGRDTDFIKIGGESVNLSRLRKIWEEITIDYSDFGDSYLIPFEDARLGHVIHLVTTLTEKMDQQLLSFNEKVLPFEKIRKVHQVDSIPKTVLGKVCHQELIKKITM